MVLLKGAGPETRRFRDWLLGPAATGWHWNASLPLLTHSAGGFILLGLILALLCHFNQDDAR